MTRNYNGFAANVSEYCFVLPTAIYAGKYNATGPYFLKQNIFIPDGRQEFSWRPFRSGTRMPGQLPVPIYARSSTEFFAKIVDARISFITDAQGQATPLVLHQRGGHHSMQRIDAAAAQEIAGQVAERMKSQSANPGTEAALLRLIEGLTRGEPDYQEMSSSLAEATRVQLPDLHSSHAELGAVQSVRFLGVGRHGDDVYTVRHANGASHWRIALDANGRKSMAWVSPGP